MKKLNKMENGKNLIHSFNHIDNCEGNLKGLTKREYFAAMAMQGYIATGKGSSAGDWVRCADELLKALETIKSE